MEITTEVKAFDWVRVSKILGSYYQAHQHQLAHMIEKEDFVNNVIENLLRRGMEEKFDASLVSSFEALIFNIARRYATDVYRKQAVRVSNETAQFVEINSTAREDSEGRSYAEILEGSGQDSIEMNMIYFDLVRLIPDIRISPNYVLTWKGLFFHLVEGLENTKIAEMYEISVSRVNQLINHLRSACESGRIYEGGCFA